MTTCPGLAQCPVTIISQREFLACFTLELQSQLNISWPFFLALLLPRHLTKNTSQSYSSGYILASEECRRDGVGQRDGFTILGYFESPQPSGLFLFLLCILPALVHVFMIQCSHWTITICECVSLPFQVNRARSCLKKPAEGLAMGRVWKTNGP